MSDQNELPSGRSRTGEPVTSRGTVALEDSLWEFVVQQRKSTGLSKNGVLRRALFVLKRAVESGIDPSASEHSEAYKASNASGESSMLDIRSTLGIPANILEKLSRMRFLHAVLRTEELPEAALQSEYLSLQAEMLPLFMPLMEQLIRAGLITVETDIDDVEGILQFSSVFGEPAYTFENGNIWIAAKHSGGMLRGNSRR